MTIWNIFSFLDYHCGKIPAKPKSTREPLGHQKSLPQEKRWAIYIFFSSAPEPWCLHNTHIYTHNLNSHLNPCVCWQNAVSSRGTRCVFLGGKYWFVRVKGCDRSSLPRRESDRGRLGFRVHDSGPANKWHTSWGCSFGFRKINIDKHALHFQWNYQYCLPAF